jgi:hypothetical protein
MSVDIFIGFLPAERIAGSAHHGDEIASTLRTERAAHQSPVKRASVDPSRAGACTIRTFKPGNRMDDWFRPLRRAYSDTEQATTGRHAPQLIDGTSASRQMSLYWSERQDITVGGQ